MPEARSTISPSSTYEQLQYRVPSPGANFGATEPVFEVITTIFYQSTNEVCRERIDVLCRGAEVQGSTRVSLAFEEERYTQTFDAPTPISQWRSEFWVDEFSSPRTAQLTVRNGSQRWNFTTRVAPKRKWTVYVVPSAPAESREPISILPDGSPAPT